MKIENWKSKIGNWQLKICNSSFVILALLLPLTASAFSISITAGNAGTGLVGHWELSESAENRGSNIVTNGDFDTDSSWTKATGWTISDGKAHYNGSTSGNIYQTFAVAGRQYFVAFDVTDYTSGNVQGVGFTTVPVSASGVGHYEGIGVSAMSIIGIRGIANSQLSIDNVIVKEIQAGDSTPSGNGGALVNSPTYTTDRHGNANGAMSFDGVDDYVSVEETSQLPTGASPRTFSFWMNPDITGNKNIMGYGTNANSQLWDILLTSGIVGIHYYSSAPSSDFPNTVYTTGQWQQVVFTYDGTSIRSYINGALKDTKVISLNTTDSGVLEIGDGIFVNYNYFDGSISDVRIYDRALSAREIKRLYDGGDAGLSSGTSQKGLVGHWPLNTKSVQSDNRSLVNSSAGRSYIASEQAYGTWEFDFNKAEDQNGVAAWFIGDRIDMYVWGGFGYGLQYTAGERIYLLKVNGTGGGTLLDTGPAYLAPNNTDYRIKVERTRDGTFTVYIKGDGKIGTAYPNGSDDYVLVDVTGGSGTNPVTDNTYTTSAYMVADLDAGDKISNVHTDNGFISVDSFIDGTGTTSVSGNKVIADTTPNANAGTVYGADVRNHGYDFDGVDDYISLSDHPVAFVDDTPWTVSFWANADDFIQRGFMGNTFTPGEYEYLAMSDNDTFRFSGPNNGMSTWDLPSTISTGQWYHYVITCDGTNSDPYVLYIDSVSKGGASPVSTNSKITIENFGAIDDGTTWKFDGALSDVRLYDRALSASEVQQLYNNVDVSGAVGHWPLDDGPGDMSGNGNHGTVSGATLVGEAASFDGVDDYIYVGSVQSLGETTVTLWFKSTDTGSHNMLIDFSEINSRGYFDFNHTGDGRPLLYLAGSNYRYFDATAANYLDGDWHFLVLYIKGSAILDINSATLNIDNTFIAAGSTATHELPNAWDDLIIGKATEYSFFDGYISDTRIYNRALSASDITQLYSEGHTAPKQASTTSLNKGLIGHWPLTKEALKGDNRSLDNSSAGTSYVSSTQAYGTWEFDVYKGDDGNQVRVAFIGGTNLPYLNNPGYALYFYSGEDIRLYRWDVGTAGLLARTSASYLSLNTWYRIKVTRSAAGLFTMYIKGGAYGDIDGSTWTTVDTTGGSGTNPAIDTTYTTSAYMVADLDAGDKIRNVHTDNGFFAPTEFTDGTGTTSVVGNTTTADTTPNENVGTIYGADTRNHGYEFDGGGVIVANDSTFGDLGTGDFTIALWQKQNDTTYRGPIGKGSNSTGKGWRIYTSASGFPNQAFQLMSESSNDAGISMNNIADGVWHHIVIVGDRSENMTSYVDGVAGTPNNISALSANSYSNSDFLRIGDSDYNSAWKGNIADFRIYDRAFSASEVMNLYHGKDVASPIGYWPLDKNATDYSGNGNHGTVSGAKLVGESTSFDGVDDYIDTGAGAISILSTEDFTFAGWANIQDLGDTWKMLMTDDSMYNRYSLYSIHGGIKPMWYHHWNTSPYYKNLMGSTWTTTGWHHIILKRVGTTYTFYQDGVETTSDSWESDFDLDHLFIGKATAQFQNGQLSDIRVYDRGLSAREAQMLYNMGRP